MDNGEPIGELIETSTTELVAQACELGVAPAFGSLVRVGAPNGDIFGLVYAVRTGGVDPGAQAVLRGHGGVRDAAIYRENPDLNAVLRTSFSALVVGFCDNGALRQYLPPHPAPLHWSVYECPDAQLAEFTHQLDYLRSILTASAAPIDELAAANLRLARQARPFEPTFALRAGRELARLLADDYGRLSSILRRIGA
jgi:hypothetical protein